MLIFVKGFLGFLSIQYSTLILDVEFLKMSYFVGDRDIYFGIKLLFDFRIGLSA